MDDPTVLIVGCGATGAGVARDLALRGVDVALVDRDGLDGGTSGRSHGLLHSGARYAESDPAGARACLAENRTLRDIAGACVHETGGLFLQLDTDDPGYVDAKLDACESVGIPATVIDGESARAQVPGLSEAVDRAIEVPDAVVAPSRLVAANVADARNHGATVHTDAPVTGMTVEQGRIAGVDLGGSLGERVHPAFVVNATGAWAGHIAAMAGLEVTMQPTRGVMVSVEYAGLDRVLNRCRPPDDGDIVVPRESTAVLGTTSVAVEEPDAYPTAEWEVERTREECAAMLPAVGGAPTVRTWWGVRPLYATAEEERSGRGISRGFTLLDHAASGVENLVTIVGGKLTTYRRMAAATAELVCERLEVGAECTTDEHRLPHVDDPDRLDALVAALGGPGPADEAVVGGAIE